MHAVPNSTINFQFLRSGVPCLLLCISSYSPNDPVRIAVRKHSKVISSILVTDRLPLYIRVHKCRSYVRNHLIINIPLLPMNSDIGIIGTITVTACDAYEFILCIHAYKSWCQYIEQFGSVQILTPLSVCRNVRGG